MEVPQVKEAVMERSKRPKIVVIGAASSSFSGLMRDFIASKDLDGCELALVDIDKPGLDSMAKLAGRMAREWGSKTKVSGTSDRRRALKGADFVIITIAVGGVEAWRQDEEIPAKHGFFGRSVDTAGPGGLFRGLRLIPPLLEICRDIERLCPDAVVINYSNPMTAICRAIRKATEVRIVGLCTDGFLPEQIAYHMGIDSNRVDVISAGLNHWVWALRILVDGKDATEEFKELMRTTQRPGTYGFSSLELMDIFDAWPMPTAHHVATFFPYFYGRERDGRSVWRYPFRTGRGFNERIKAGQALRRKLKRQAEGKEPLGQAPEESGEETVRMLTSIWYDRRTRHYANVENNGLVANLPDDAVVEIPVIADAAGIRGLPVGPLPASLAGLVQARVAFFELLADAAIEKSRHIALQCLMADTNTTSITRAKACLDEMFSAQREFLPGYN